MGLSTNCTCSCFRSPLARGHGYFLKDSRLPNSRSRARSIRQRRPVLSLPTDSLTALSPAEAPSDAVSLRRLFACNFSRKEILRALSWEPQAWLRLHSSTVLGT